MAWTAPVWFEPDTPVTPPAPAAPNMALEVNLIAERATISNLGNDAVNLEGWTLVSVQGNQTFTFPTLTLQPGQSVVVASGPSAEQDPPATLRWTTSHIWRNSGDPGELRDTNNVVRAGTQ